MCMINCLCWNKPKKKLFPEHSDETVKQDPSEYQEKSFREADSGGWRNVEQTGKAGKHS